MNKTKKKNNYIYCISQKNVKGIIKLKIIKIKIKKSLTLISHFKISLFEYEIKMNLFFFNVLIIIEK